MLVTPLKTRILWPPRDDLFGAIKNSLKKIPEGSILAVASKIVSIAEGRCITMATVVKDDLIRQEANWYLPRARSEWGIMHTITRGMLAPTAGIDESNGNGYYILWPKDPMKSAAQLLRWLKRTYGVKHLGVLVTDSRSMPLRRGVVGVALGYAGFSPLNDERGKKDLFDHRLNITQTNIADGLAAAAALAMGEGNESTPLALITDISFIYISGHTPRQSRRLYSSYMVPLQEDLYAPFLRSARWKKGRGAV